MIKSHKILSAIAVFLLNFNISLFPVIRFALTMRDRNCFVST
ncbi:MAG: hypothetical protein V7L21_09325 [Nostoc sp.]|nr:hypothetical protein [Nostoc sp. NMS9]